jgi:hypothetical protein
LGKKRTEEKLKDEEEDAMLAASITSSRILGRAG